MTSPNVASGVSPIPLESGPPPLSLYIHIPWCVRKCPYCDFNSHEVQGALPEADYVSAVLRDLDHEAHRIEGREVQTIFVGGGTPSLLSGEAVRSLLSGVRARIKVAAPAEVTLESNPGSVDGPRLVDYQEAGVNRLSIGVQSFRAPQLAALGRIHSGDDALRAFETARRAGVSNINLDLMFGLPDDDVGGCLADLAQAMALGPEHLSWYQLAIEPNTAFYRHPPRLPDDDQVFAAYQAGRALLRNHGYLQYEVSAYARQGAECRHNRNYWEFGDYLGIGAGAHGKLSDLANRRVVRNAKRAKPLSYMNGSYSNSAGSPAAIVEGSPLTAAQLTVEFMMNALRLAAGFPLSLFTARTGLPIAAIESTLQEARERGLIEVQGDWLTPTEWGYRYLNELVYLFYRDEPDPPRGAAAS
ncbi:MAG: radical SAM family heme chaperone HemW [Gammaproteobacteria bacterium]